MADLKASNISRIDGTSSKNNYGFYAIVDIGEFNTTIQKIPVSISLYIENNTIRFNSSGWTISIIVDGVENKTTNVRINSTIVDYHESFLVKQITTNIEPSKNTINVSASLTKNSYSTYDPGKCSLKGDVSLPNIFSIWSIGLLALSNIEDEFSLQFNKYIEEYTNVVTISDLQMETIVRTINNANNGDKVKFTEEELNTIYTMGDNKSTNTLRFYLNLYTYDKENNQIGITQRLPADGYLSNSKPIATYTITEQDSEVIKLLGENSNYVVSEASDLLFNVSPQAQKGATIDKVMLDNVNIFPNENVYQMTLNDVKKSKFTLSIIDSRKNETNYNIEKTLIPYIPININSVKFKRESQTSSKILLNTNIMCYNGNIGDKKNNIIVSFRLEGDSTYTIIPSSEYVIENNILSISEYILPIELPFNQSKTIYLLVSDLLTGDEENEDVLKGIPTFEAGEHDFQVNGNLYIADINRENKINVLNLINSLGTIVEQATNSLGTYVKFSTGLMVTFQEQEVNTNIASAWGGVFSSSTLTLPNFPQSFIDIPETIITKKKATGNGSNFWIMQIGVGNKNNPGNYQLLRGTSVTNVSAILSIIGIGMWK